MNIISANVIICLHCIYIVCIKIRDCVYVAGEIIITLFIDII